MLSRKEILIIFFIDKNNDELIPQLNDLDNKIDE